VLTSPNELFLQLRFLFNLFQGLSIFYELLIKGLKHKVVVVINCNLVLILSISKKLFLNNTKKKKFTT